MKNGKTVQIEDNSSTKNTDTKYQDIGKNLLKLKLALS